MPALSQAACAVAIVSGLAPQARRAGIVGVITDASRLVVRSWIGGADGGYDMAKLGGPHPNGPPPNDQLLER
jgi:alpha-L-rhamnosidase